MNRVRNFSYIPHTEADQQKMMQVLEIDAIEALFQDVPQRVRLGRDLALDPALSELDLNRHMQALADRNRDLNQLVSFLGAGSYEHYQPSVVDAIIGRSEFYTSYTPYQPEISQGLLQATFEYQTMAAELTGMDLANASMYDGPTAFAEAGMVCCAATGRDTLVVAGTVHPEYRAVLDTYAAGQSIGVREVPTTAGRVDLDGLRERCATGAAGVMVQYPNFFGCIEDLAEVAAIAHAAGALLVVAAYPIALGLLEAPGHVGADIVVAEGQSLGNAMAFGGPYLGIMAAKRDLMRRMPGRIVGETVDTQGRRGFVLTLQAREQHIRREKASSNICSNQALNALAATVFMSYMGPQGMRDLALQNYHKAHYFADRLTAIPGVRLAFPAPFFNEFVIRIDAPVDRVLDQLLAQDILFGLALKPFHPDLPDAILLNVTEVRTRVQLDSAAAALEAIL